MKTVAEKKVWSDARELLEYAAEMRKGVRTELGRALLLLSDMIGWAEPEEPEDAREFRRIARSIRVARRLLDAERLTLEELAGHLRAKHPRSQDLVTAHGGEGVGPC